MIDKILRRVRDAGALDDNYGAENWTNSDKEMEKALTAIYEIGLGVIDRMPERGFGVPKGGKAFEEGRFEKLISEAEVKAAWAKACGVAEK